ncbi:MAG: UUP1 family membrane protein [Desulfobacterales bacterium]|nr:MAG: UUP1 family membrane protein [Desulfobacterales bacterium]
MNKRHLYLLAGSLATIGLILFFYKLFVMDFPLVPEVKTYIWNIEAHLTFEAGNKPAKVSMFIPRNSSRFTIVNENFVSKGYGVNVSTEKGQRQVHWSIRKAKGPQSLYYRATVIRMDRDVIAPKPAISKQKGPDLEGAYLEASKALITEVRKKSADTDSLVTGLFKRLNALEPGDSAALLLGKKATVHKKVDLAVQLLALAGIHARAVHGIRLEEQRREAPVVHWLEVYEKDSWISYEPASGVRDIPEDYLAWWRDMVELVQAQGVKKLNVSMSVVRGEEAALQLAVEKGIIKKPFLLDFSLFSLPVQIQAVYRVLLLVPIGVLFLVILRNVIGIRTFGTFMPVLIALSFRETQLLWGIFLFTTLIGIGLLIRLYLEHLKLLVVPRLAAILIVVIGLMALLSVLTNKLGLERGISVALFPMVILSMTIERMSIVWEELGAFEAIKQGTGSLIAAAIAYLIMSVKYVEHLLFVFPEILLILLAATILLGRYSGFRLLELRRFKALADIKSDV